MGILYPCGGRGPMVMMMMTLRLGYLLLSSLQGICGKIAWGATYEAICAENVINE